MTNCSWSSTGSESSSSNGLSFRYSRPRKAELGLAGVQKFLRRHQRIALDTSVFIYQLEANLKYLPLTDHIFSWLERPGS